MSAFDDETARIARRKAGEREAIGQVSGVTIWADCDCNLCRKVRGEAPRPDSPKTKSAAGTR